MRGIIIGVGCIMVAVAVLTGTVHAQEAEGFEWSWGPDGKPKDGTPAEPGASDAALDPDTYNQLLKENLGLRRKLQETDRGSESMREENARLQREMTKLQSQITSSAGEIERLRSETTSSVDPEKVASLEAALAAAESAKAKLAQDLGALKSRVERNESRPPPAKGPAVKPGSDLFRALEDENSELRSKLSDLESEKAKVVKELREVESEAAAKGELEAEMADISGETAKHKAVIVKLLERIPELEQELAETQSRERELRALKVELDKREERLKKAERVATLLAKTRTEVQYAGASRQRDVHYNMGVVFANRGQFKEAEREYLRALRLDPADADTHYNLAVLYDQNLKQYRKAVSHYRRYLRLRPDAPDANDVRVWMTMCETR
ncbi:MAG: tetratricopeptide repeat protein [Kiritimatiellia bacterium]|nr:tetratricopeptide repeat protein [Kiritimatiellia bacterium]